MILQKCPLCGATVPFGKSRCEDCGMLIKSDNATIGECHKDSAEYSNDRYGRRVHEQIHRQQEQQKKALGVKKTEAEKAMRLKRTEDENAYRTKRDEDEKAYRLQKAENETAYRTKKDETAKAAGGQFVEYKQAVYPSSTPSASASAPVSPPLSSPPKKKKASLSPGLIVFLVVIAINIISSISESLSENNFFDMQPASPAPEISIPADSADPVSIILGEISEPMDTEYFTFSVDGVEALAGFEDLAREEGNKVIGVKIAVTNTTAGNIYMYDTDFYVELPDGTEVYSIPYQGDPNLPLQFEDTYILPAGELGAGMLLFEVPKDSVGGYICHTEIITDYETNQQSVGNLYKIKADW